MLKHLKQLLSDPVWQGIAGVATVIAIILTAYQVAQSFPISLTPNSTAIPSAKSTPSNPLTAADQIQSGCISVNDWTPFGEHAESFRTPVPVSPVPQSKCWFLYDWGIYAENQGLSFRLDQRNMGYSQYGISTPVSPDTDVEFEFIVTSMSMDDRFEAGIISGTSPNSDGNFFTIWGVQSGRKMHGYTRQQGKEAPFIFSDFSGDKHKLRMQIVAARLDVYLDDQKITRSPVNAVYSAPRLWIGYQLSEIGGKVSAYVSKLSIVTK